MAMVMAAARDAGLRVFYALHHRYRPGDYETSGPPRSRAGARVADQVLRGHDVGRRDPDGVRAARGRRGRARALGFQRLRQHRPRPAAQAPRHPSSDRHRVADQHVRRANGPTRRRRARLQADRGQGRHGEPRRARDARLARGQPAQLRGAGRRPARSWTHCPRSGRWPVPEEGDSHGFRLRPARAHPRPAAPARCRSRIRTRRCGHTPRRRSGVESRRRNSPQGSAASSPAGSSRPAACAST